MLGKNIHGDQGFTLIELLVAIMISGLILGALTTGFIVTLKGTKGTHERLVESHDAQLLAAYLPSDAQSADPALIALDGPAVTATTTPTGCGAGSVPPGGSTNRLRLQWTELASDATLTGFSVSYRLEGVSAAEAKL